MVFDVAQMCEIRIRCSFMLKSAIHHLYVTAKETLHRMLIFILWWKLRRYINHKPKWRIAFDAEIFKQVFSIICAFSTEKLIKCSANDMPKTIDRVYLTGCMLCAKPLSSLTCHWIHCDIIRKLPSYNTVAMGTEYKIQANHRAKPKMLNHVC